MLDLVRLLDKTNMIGLVNVCNKFQLFAGLEVARLIRSCYLAYVRLVKGVTMPNFSSLAGLEMALLIRSR